MMVFSFDLLRGLEPILNDMELSRDGLIVDAFSFEVVGTINCGKDPIVFELNKRKDTQAFLASIYLLHGGL